jgi:hypothetical protein
VLLTPVLVTPIRLLLANLPCLVLLVLERHTKILVHGLIGRQQGGLLGRRLLRSCQNLHQCLSLAPPQRSALQTKHMSKI